MPEAKHGQSNDSGDEGIGNSLPDVSKLNQTIFESKYEDNQDTRNPDDGDDFSTPQTHLQPVKVQEKYAYLPSPTDLAQRPDSTRTTSDYPEPRFLMKQPSSLRLCAGVFSVCVGLSVRPRNGHVYSSFNMLSFIDVMRQTKPTIYPLRNHVNSFRYGTPVTVTLDVIANFPRRG
jgi:hypothetical protein